MIKDEALQFSLVAHRFPLPVELFTPSVPGSTTFLCVSGNIFPHWVVTSSSIPLIVDTVIVVNV